MALLVLYILFYLLKLGYKFKFLKNIVKFLGSMLIWNGLIRLYMELYQDLSQSSVLNMYTADWETNFTWVKVSNYYGLAGFIIVTALPILLFIPFYCCRRKRWSNKKF